MRRTGFLSASSCSNSGGATATFVGPSSCSTLGGTGSCTVVISSTTGGSTTINATTTVTVGGVSLTRSTGDGKAGDSSDANKTWGACPPDSSQINTTLDASGNVTVDFIQSLINANDNSYGTNALWVGTPKGAHKFADLTGSDKAEFIFKDKNGKVVLDFFIDYITLNTAGIVTPSGYSSLGAFDGDGKIVTGNAAPAATARCPAITPLVSWRGIRHWLKT